MFVVDFEGLEVTHVDADDLGADALGDLDFFGGVGFDEGVHAERFGEFEEFAQGLLVEGCDDEQDQVGAVCACLPDLVFVDGEVLAEYGDVHGGADCVQVGDGAVEAALFGEHGDRCGATCLVACGKRGGVGDFAERTLGR
ncbi:Uncharacterised protein [Mycobacterium tuberculosis]|nr:Uncharacterised protein [Mycobacterium tuberculosis]